jgi:hypothetical protein
MRYGVVIVVGVDGDVREGGRIKLESPGGVKR